MNKKYSNRKTAGNRIPGKGRDIIVRWSSYLIMVILPIVLGHMMYGKFLYFKFKYIEATAKIEKLSSDSASFSYYNEKQKELIKLNNVKFSNTEITKLGRKKEIEIRYSPNDPYLVDFISVKELSIGLILFALLILFSPLLIFLYMRPKSLFINESKE